jgi:hypothetical protein
MLLAVVLLLMLKMSEVSIMLLAYNGYREAA